MDRRHFLRYTGLVSAGLALRRTSMTAAGAAADPDAEAPAWRTFEVTTNVEVLQPAGRTRIWLPTPLTIATPYQKPLGNSVHADGGTTSTVADPKYANAIACIDFPDGARPLVSLTSRIATRDHRVDVGQPAATVVALPPAERACFLQATSLLPTDGIVKTTATEITRGARTDADKARAIYDWIVEHTYRDGKVRGCGVGDIRAMLESQNLGGKCADLNALFVGLSRAAGLPARDVYGLRVARSARGFKSLGPATTNVTKAQHCRAEVHLAHHGWVPVDPADVRKVILEEPPGNLPPESDPVRTARAALFGSWEMNWIAFNFAHDVTLPGSTGGRLGFFMYPQAETAGGRLDCLDPENFKYEITAREVT